MLSSAAMTLRMAFIVTMALVATLTIFVEGAGSSAQSNVQDDCGKCGGQTPPSARAGAHGGLSWQSDADALGSGDPYSIPHCFVQTVLNNNDAPADFRWTPANWANDRFPPKTEEKKCSVSAAPGNPPASGPITVNYAGSATTYVWKPITQQTTNEFSPLTTTLHSSLYGANGAPERVIVTFASYVRVVQGEGYEYIYFVGIRRPSNPPAPVTGRYQLGFGQFLRVIQADFEKTGRLSAERLLEPARVSFTSSTQPAHFEGEVTLRSIKPEHAISLSVEIWIPRPQT